MEISNKYDLELSIKLEIINTIKLTITYKYS